MYWAACNCHDTVVEVLFKGGADPRGLGPDGSTAMYVAARNGHINVLRAMVSLGMSQSAGATVDRTPLWGAINERDRWCVEVLLEAGADPNSVDSAGRTGLHFAAGVGDAEFARVPFVRRVQLQKVRQRHRRVALSCRRCGVQYCNSCAHSPCVRRRSERTNVQSRGRHCQCINGVSMGL